MGRNRNCGRNGIRADVDGREARYVPNPTGRQTYRCRVVYPTVTGSRARKVDRCRS